MIDKNHCAKCGTQIDESSRVCFEPDAMTVERQQMFPLYLCDDCYLDLIEWLCNVPTYHELLAHAQKGANR